MMMLVLLAFVLVGLTVLVLLAFITEGIYAVVKRDDGS
jgi:hypothetical protein